MSRERLKAIIAVLHLQMNAFPSQTRVWRARHLGGVSELHRLCFVPCIQAVHHDVCMKTAMCQIAASFLLTKVPTAALQLTFKGR